MRAAMRKFVIMARTDAFAREGRQAALERTVAYVEAGADMIFAEALYTLEDYAAFTRAIRVPVLANLTEFGLTPYFTVAELERAGVKMILYPLTAFRAMSRAAEQVYAALREHGTQRPVLETLQTREELYAVLKYYDFERKLDELYARAGEGRPLVGRTRASSAQAHAVARVAAALSVGSRLLRVVDPRRRHRVVDQLERRIRPEVEQIHEVVGVRGRRRPARLGARCRSALSLGAVVEAGRRERRAQRSRGPLRRTTSRPSNR